jgi:hypothetical protein
MTAFVFRFYSFEPRDVFLMVGERWPVALVRRNAWKIGGSDIWYSTVAFDEQVAASEFEEWLARSGRKADIRGYLGHTSGGAYRDIVLHDPEQRTSARGDLLFLLRARYRIAVRSLALTFRRLVGRF